MKRLFFLFICSSLLSHSQTTNGGSKKDTSSFKMGVNYGQTFDTGGQIADQDYYYSNQYLKFQVERSIKSGKLDVTLLVEPSFYTGDYRLLNKWYIKPDEPNYLSQREFHTTQRSFEEYVLNIGLKFSHNVAPKTQLYVLASVGPMITTIKTDRLNKGFAFSDILGLGINYDFKTFLFDMRATLRHNSNANLSSPNGGVNSLGFETGISFRWN